MAQIDRITALLSHMTNASAVVTPWFFTKYQSKTVVGFLVFEAVQCASVCLYLTPPPGFPKATTAQDIEYGVPGAAYTVVTERKRQWLEIPLPSETVRIGPGLLVDDKHSIFPAKGSANPVGIDILACERCLTLGYQPRVTECSCLRPYASIAPPKSSALFTAHVAGPIDTDLSVLLAKDFGAMSVSRGGAWSCEKETMVAVAPRSIATEGPQGYRASFDRYATREVPGLQPKPLFVVQVAPPCATQMDSVVFHAGIRPGNWPTSASNNEATHKVRVDKKSKRVSFPADVQLVEERMFDILPGEERSPSIDDVLAVQDTTCPDKRLLKGIIQSSAVRLGKNVLSLWADLYTRSPAHWWPDLRNHMFDIGHPGVSELLDSLPMPDLAACQDNARIHERVKIEDGL